MKIGNYEFTVSQELIALIVTIIIIAITVTTFFVNTYNKSFQSNLLEHETEKVSNYVKIYENSLGIPHIKAANEHDMIFAMGYMHAKDRLWQLEYNRRLMQGRLAELFGKKYVETDMLFRTFDFDSKCKKIFSSLSAHEKYILKVYSKGINEYINSNHDKLPFEFGLFNIIPQKWQPYHSILIQRLFALESSYGFWYEPIFGDIAKNLGSRTINELMPGNTSNSPIVFTENQNLKIEDYILPPDSSKLTDSSHSISSIVETMQKAADLLSIVPGENGCNVWIARKDMKNKNSSPILCNDFHSSLTLPNKWYQMHYSCPKINVIGYTLPGVPFALAGRNNHCSWGYTSARIDDIDYFYYKVDATSKNFFPDSSQNKKKIKLIIDTLKIAKSRPYIYFKKKINNEFILNGKIFGLGYTIKPERLRRYRNHYGITFKWLGNYKSNEIEALYQLSKSKTYNDFKKASSYWKVPGAVFAYCDQSGDIALELSANQAIRNKNINPLIPNLIVNKENPWLGIRNLKGSILNPKNNFLVAANNSLFMNDSNYLSSYFAAPSRAKRISELLFTTNSYNISEAQIMQNDIYSSYANDILSVTLPVWKQHKNLFNNKQLEAFKALKNWDCIYSTESYEASIFTIFIERLIFNTFSDELGKTSFNKFYFYPMLSNNKIYDLLINYPTSPWFDNINTSNSETSYYIVFKSLMEGINILTKRFGTSDISKWKYGLIRKIKPVNLLEESGVYTKIGIVEPVNIGGNAFTITNTYIQKEASFAASYRFVADLKDTVIYSIIPGGASGDPISPNYSNQYKVWSNSGYIMLPYSQKVRDYFSLKVILKPKS